jgi:hypothetical protein
MQGRVPTDSQLALLFFAEYRVYVGCILAVFAYHCRCNWMVCWFGPVLLADNAAGDW